MENILCWFEALCRFRLVSLIFGQGMFLLPCAHSRETVIPGESVCRAVANIEQHVFLFWFTSWQYGYLCAFFRTFRDAGPRHRCVLVLQIYNFVSFITKRAGVFSVCFLQQNIWHELQPHAKREPAWGISISVLCIHVGPSIIFLPADMRPYCVRISGEEIPDGASPPPINVTLAPGPGECVVPCCKHSELCLLNLDGFHFGSHLCSFGYYFVSNMWIRCLDKAMILLTCGQLQGHSGTCREYLKITLEM